MVKILFFIERLSIDGTIGGAEKVLCNLVNHMDPKKYDVTVHTVFPDKAAYMLKKNICFKSIFKHDMRLFQWIYRLETALGLTYILHLKSEYDIEIAFLEFGATKVMAASTNKNAKKLAWVHCDLEDAIIDKNKFRKKTRTYYRNMNKVVCVSEKAKNSFFEIFGNAYETVVLHNVVDDEEIKRKALYELPGNIEKRKITLLAVGRLSPPKNYIRLLKAVNKLIKDGFDFDLWIVGEGTERKSLETYIKENQLSHVVKLWGFQKNPYPFMQRADLLVCSSNYEGYSTFVTEGLILGKPIITTECSGMRELLGDSEFGLIVPNNDDAFYEGLKKILSDSAKTLYRMNRQAMKRSDDFKIDKLVSDVDAFFDQILSKPHEI